MKHWVWIALLLPRLVHAAEPDAIGERLDESIAALKPIIARAHESERPLLMFRLAELIWRKADHVKAKEMLAHDTAYVAWVEAGQKGEPPEVEAFTRESRALRRNAVANYRRAAASAERADEIRFHLAYALYEIGETEEAIRTYSDLVRLFPESRFSAQASLQLGEHYFSKNQLERAEEAFERAYQRGERDVRDHALYKLAWCDFNRSDYSAGIEKLKRTAHREAIEDLPLFYAHAGELDEAFSSLAPRQLLRLASILEEQGKWSLSIGARRRLLERRIGNAGDNRIALMETLAKTGQTDELIAEAKLLDLRSDHLDRVRSLANEHHRIKSYAAAELLYRMVLELSVDPETSYFHGGVLFELGRFREAAGAFSLAAKTPGPHQTTAAHDEVLAREKLLRPNDRASSKAFVDACTAYAAIAPNDRESLPKFLARAAQVLESLEDWTALEKLARSHGMSAIAEGASYKRIQQDESRVRQLSGAARELGLAEIAEQFDRFAREFTRSRYADEALLSAALIYSEIGRVDAAMEVSSWMAERYGKSEHAPRNTLLYAELHERIADFERAARIYHQFAHDHPSHAEAPRALKQAGLHYAAAGKNEQAKAAFERFASLYPREPDAAPVRLRACDIDLDLKRWRSAERCYAKAGSSVRALSGRGVALSRMKRAKAAQRLFASAVASYERLSQDEKGGEVRTAAARAAFELIEPELARYRRMRIERSFVRMAAALDRLARSYAKVIDMGDPEHAVASLTRIGESYRIMANAVGSAAVPPGLTLEQRTIYLAGIQEQVVALETRAIEAYELALEKGRKLHVSDKWIEEAIQGLEAPLKSAQGLDEWPD